MKIQNRLSLLFTGLVGGFLLIFSLIIYLSASNSRTKEFYALLEKEALTKANLLLETQLDAETLQTIYRQNREIIHEVEVAIYDGASNLVYHDAVDIDVVKETPEMLHNIMEKGKITFFERDWQVVGIALQKGANQYLITAAAYDEYGYSKLRSLGNALILVYSVGMLIVYLSSRYFAKRALLPVGEMVKEAQNISISNLDLRLNQGTNKDELWQLASTFNRMLERLEKSFEAQKQFAYYIAHELRTPLSSIISELEWAQREGRGLQDKHNSISQVLNDARNLAKLSTSLLDFAKASFDRSEINFRIIRVDEVLLDATEHIQKANPTFKVKINFEGVGEGEVSEMNVMGNSYLLTTAFTTLIDNACKFSPDHTCSIKIVGLSEQVELFFQDKGPGIPLEEKEAIFEPFFRGKNRLAASGNGIGLALVKRILELHHGTVALVSAEEEGACFKVKLSLV